MTRPRTGRPYPLGATWDGRGVNFALQSGAAQAPKSVVVDPAFDWGGVSHPRTPWNRTVFYEVHVKGFTKTHPGVPDELRGTYAGLASPAAIEHLKRLGVTAVELLPVHAFV